MATVHVLMQLEQTPHQKCFGKVERAFVVEAMGAVPGALALVTLPSAKKQLNFNVMEHAIGLNKHTCFKQEKSN